MDVQLEATKRTGAGKGAARALRREELVPAVVYGPKTEPQSIAVSARRLEKLLKDMGEESRLLQLLVENAEARQVIIREVQIHPVRRRFLHVDFYEVPMDHPIEVEVPIELIGESVGVKKGGTLNLISRTVSVRCLPNAIPERFQIDVSKVDLGDSIHVSDVSEGASFQLIGEPGAALVNVTAPEGSSKGEEA